MIVYKAIHLDFGISFLIPWSYANLMIIIHAKQYSVHNNYVAEINILKLQQ